MRKLNLFVVLFVGLILAFGCQKEEDSNNDNNDNVVGTINLNNDSYDVVDDGNIIQLINDGGTTSGSITITGSNSTNTLMVSLAIEYDNTDGISGNYENGDNSSASHVFRPWLTQLNINKNDGSSSQSYNEPDGTLEVMHNSDNNYTVDFDMTFKDSLNVVGDLTCDFIEQQVN